MEGTKINLSSKDDCKTYRIPADVQSALVEADVDVFVMDNPEKKGGKYLFSVEYSGKVLYEKITHTELKKVAPDIRNMKFESLMPEKTQYQLDYERFEMPENGLHFSVSDYANNVKLCREHVQFLLKSTERNALKIGVILNVLKCRHIRSGCGEVVFMNGVYKTLNNIYDYAAFYFGISRGSCSQFMNIAERFTKNEIDCVTGEVELLNDFKGFGVSQLVQMLPYDLDVIKYDIAAGQLEPGDSVRTIRKNLKILHPVQSEAVLLQSVENNQEIRGQMNLEDYEDAEAFDEAVNDVSVSECTEDVREEFEEASETELKKSYSFSCMSDYDACIKMIKRILASGYALNLSVVKK